MNLNNKTVILASASPRRKQLLKNLVEDFLVEVADIDENLPIEIPEILVEELALLKASAVASNLAKDEEFAEKFKNTVIIAADTIVVHGGQILGKPKTKTDAIAMLSALSGSTHSIYTGVCVIDNESISICAKACKNTVTFRLLSAEEIETYVEGGSPMDKAGAYGIQDEDMDFVVSLEGDYYCAVGLPLKLLSEMLSNPD